MKVVYELPPARYLVEVQAYQPYKPMDGTSKLEPTGWGPLTWTNNIEEAKRRADEAFLEFELIEVRVIDTQEEAE